MSGLQIQIVSYLLKRMRKQRRGAGTDLAPTVFRNQLDKAAKREGKLPEDARIIDVQAGGVPAEWVERSSSRAHRVILYFHGGGYCAGAEGAPAWLRKYWKKSLSGLSTIVVPSGFSAFR